MLAAFGAPLARLEVQLALTALAARLETQTDRRPAALPAQPGAARPSPAGVAYDARRAR
jgi:hypothetical protein